MHKLYCHLISLCQNVAKMKVVINEMEINFFSVLLCFCTTGVERGMLVREGKLRDLCRNLLFDRGKFGKIR